MTTAPLPSSPRPPRGLVLGASIWIAISWIALVGPRPPLQPTSLSYTPAIRMMVQSMFLLTIVAWPLLRLSLPGRARPVISAVMDTIAMLVLWQIVLWPMRLVTTWPVARVVVIDAEVVASCLAAGLVVAWCCRGRLARILGMSGLLLWSLGIPAIVATTTDALPWPLSGPFVRAWTESGRGPDEVMLSTSLPALVTLVVLGLAWGVCGVLVRGTPPETALEADARVPMAGGTGDPPPPTVG